jgi:hypothetical protein
MCSAGGSHLWPYSRVMWAVQSADSGGTRSQTGTPGYCPPAAGARVDCQKDAVVAAMVSVGVEVGAWR